ncbi:MAG: ABC transporter substrate-binding protein [Acidiferrobacterales bacterium]|nr:ABC transporter substrate-binding protein [Acidiferrobacterales bacterium]
MSKKHLIDLNGHKLSRRKFIQASGALGMAGAAPGVFFAPAVQAATPSRGGHLRLGIAAGSSTDSLDPIRLISAHAQLIFYTIHGTLTEITSDGDLVPLLAESYEAGADPSEWVFKLRPDVTFHNGKSLTADDVIASINRHRGEDSASSMKAFIDGVESITKDGDLVVKFKLKTASVDFPVILSDSVLSILPSKDGKVEAFDAGCGAYTLEAFEPGQYSHFKRYEDSFMTDRGFVDTCELLTIADTAARQNALVTDVIDVMGDVDATTANLLARNENLNILNVTSTLHYTFPMRTDLAPFDNYDVRMALKLSLDREAVLDTVLSGYGSLGNDQPISPANRYYNTELEQRVYDPEKAKWHLKQAGMENLKVELSLSNSLYAGCVDTGVLFSEHAKASGIEIVPKQAPDDGYWKDVWLKHPWCASFWSGRPTEDWMFTQAYGGESNWNETFWKNDRFNELLVAARAELDEDKRRQMYWEMQAIVRDDGGAVINAFADHVSAYNNRVGAPDKVAGNWKLDGYKIFLRWWMKG